MGERAGGHDYLVSLLVDERGEKDFSWVVWLEHVKADGEAYVELVGCCVGTRMAAMLVGLWVVLKIG